MKKYFLLLVFTLTSLSVFAEEKVTNFDVFMKLNKDGSALITEKISVNVEGREIRRGIIRDLPKTFDGGRINYSNFSLMRNGRTEAFFNENNGSLLSVNFGNNDFLAHQEHDYILTYTADNVAGYFKDYDEVYWNVTGNDWIFKIDHASFYLALPHGAQVIEKDISAYTGRKGAKGKNFVKSPGELYFETTRPLMPGEGFSVAVPFAKGLMSEGAAAHTRSLAIFPPIILAALFIFYILLWRKFGKDNISPVVIAEYEPPKDITAPEAAYIWKMGMPADSDILALLLISLAVKGAAVIEDQSINTTNSFLDKALETVSAKGFTVTPELSGVEKLSEKEKNIFSLTFPDQYPLSIGAYNKKIEAVANALSSMLKTICDKYISFNSPLSLMSVLILIAAMAAPLVLFWKDFDGDTEPLLILGAVYGMLNLTLCGVSNMAVAKWTRKHKGAIGGVIFLLLIVLVLAFFYVGMLVGSGMEYSFARSSTACAVLLSLITGWFTFSIKKYTDEGTFAYNALQNFRLYLETGEGGRIAASSAQEGADLFCNYLPYAVAMGVENKWSEHFASKINTEEGRSTLSRRGLKMHSAGKAFSTTAFVSGLKSAASRASTPPNKNNGRSGSGGRGFSSGGRGGGGGRGR